MNTNNSSAQETLPILDFGSQYAQLIARRVREAGVHGILVNPDIAPEQLRRLQPIGLILSGGPASVYEQGAPKCHPGIFDLNLPVLGICYGMQIAAQILGGDVKPGLSGEYGSARLTVQSRETVAEELFAGVPQETSVWMSHADQVQILGPDFISLASTPACPMAAMRHHTRPFFGVQFHPEVTHTPHGGKILENFLKTQRQKHQEPNSNKSH